MTMIQNIPMSHGEPMQTCSTQIGSTTSYTRQRLTILNRFINYSLSASRCRGFKSSLYTLQGGGVGFPKLRLLLSVFSLSHRVHAAEGDHSELRSPLSPSPCDPILFRTRFKPKQVRHLFSRFTALHSRPASGLLLCTAIISLNMYF